VIRVAIVDDEIAIQNRLTQFIKTYEKRSPERFSIQVFSDAATLVSKYNAVYDVIFMDIQMPIMDGMTAAEHIRALDPHVIIIFVTNMADYAINGYKVDAFSYIVKPILAVDFAQQLDKVVKRIVGGRSAYLLVSSGAEIIRLDVSKIVYMESIEHRILIHMEHETLTIYNTLTKLEALVKQRHFARCNSGYLVNLSHVEKVDKEMVIVSGISLPLSRSKKKSFMTALAEYIGGEYA